MDIKNEYLIVGSGFFGCTLAHRLHNAGKDVLIVEKRNHNLRVHLDFVY